MIITKSKITKSCALSRENIQFPVVLDLSREHELSRFNFYGFESEIHTAMINAQFECLHNFEVKKWLNMNSKPAKE
jgi:hypothetical protein